MPYTYRYPSPIVTKDNRNWLLIDDPEGIRSFVNELNSIEEERDALRYAVEQLTQINARRNRQLQEAVLIIKCFQGWTSVSEAAISASEFFEKYPELDRIDERFVLAENNDELIARELLAAAVHMPGTKNVACKCESCGRVFLRSFRRAQPHVVYLTNACDCIRERKARYIHLLESQDEPI